MKNSIVAKVTSNIKLEFTSTTYDFEEIIRGTLTMQQGRGKKKIELRFIWNRQLDLYPMIYDRIYNKDEVVQLAGMLNFYSNLRREVK